MAKLDKILLTPWFDVAILSLLELCAVAPFAIYFVLYALALK